MADTLTINLTGLRLFGNHGFHAEEALMGTEFELHFAGLFPAAEAIVALEQTVDYTKIYSIIKSIFAETEKLLETVAQKIIAAIADAFPNRLHLQITITKLQAPISEFIGTVGITYARDFR